jgi:hypothetical protein
MSPKSSSSAEDATWPGDDRWSDDTAGEPDPDWPDDTAAERDPDWPDDDAADERDPDWPDDWPDEGGEDWAAPAAAYGMGGASGRRNLRPLALAAVAVVALGAGAGVALGIGRGLDNSSSPSATPSTQPSYEAPGGGTVPGGGTIPGGGAAPGGGQVGEAFIGGRVEAVSSTSITIGGPGQSITAAITAATKITGKVTSIGGVKVGDQVSAQITMSGGQATVTAIQDPAQALSGGGPP